MVIAFHFLAKEVEMVYNIKRLKDFFGLANTILVRFDREKSINLEKFSAGILFSWTEKISKELDGGVL